MALIRSGDVYRHVGCTDMNDKSSRSHTLFRIIIESKILPLTGRVEAGATAATATTATSVTLITNLCLVLLHYCVYIS